MNVCVPRYLILFLRDVGGGSGLAVSFSDAQSVNLSNYKTMPDKLRFPFYTPVFIPPTPRVISWSSFLVLLSLLAPLNMVSAASFNVMRKCRRIHFYNETTLDSCRQRSTVKDSIISLKNVLKFLSVSEKHKVMSLIDFNLRHIFLGG